MKKPLCYLILGSALATQGFTNENLEETPQLETSPAKEEYKFTPAMPARPKTWQTYVSIEVSSLANRRASFRVGKSKQSGNNSFRFGLESGVTRRYYEAYGVTSYQRHFNPFNLFSFYTGLGFNAGFIQVKEGHTFYNLMPVFSLGKIFHSETNTRSLVELRTILFQSTYLTDFTWKRHAPYRPNLQVVYGVVF